MMKRWNPWKMFVKVYIQTLIQNLGFVTPRKIGNCDDVTATCMRESKASASMAATSNINGGGTISMHENLNSVLGLQTKSHEHDGCATKMKSGDTKAVMSNTKGGGSHEQGGSLLGLKKGFLFGKPSVTRKLAKSGGERSLVLGSPNEIRNLKSPKGAGITDLEAKDIANNVAEIKSLNHNKSPNEGWSSNDNGNNNPNTDRISVPLEETITKQPGTLVDRHNNRASWNSRNYA
ncbi:hypothetical protein FRX31_004350 [Thalictrum thalictroides]|uniref:Uncharacterized protein n=1 Tax=Thalictrum thalictroides TaxID=46969 RepID=A0A7J6X9D2_THATH|nr:hypothetical protein FRX31_004350 [Thalictrum thalictroides]